MQEKLKENKDFANDNIFFYNKRFEDNYAHSVSLVYKMEPTMKDHSILYEEAGYSIFSKSDLIDEIKKLKNKNEKLRKHNKNLMIDLNDAIENTVTLFKNIKEYYSYTLEG